MTKRLFDIVAAAVGLLILSPLFVVIAIATVLDSPGPVFFRQVRVGRHGKRFLIFKFRTMYHDPHGDGLKLTVGGDLRVTRVGAFLRHYKLDELPQLIDVLRGTMSLVGPRPEVPKYVAHYPEEVRRRVLSVRPGITDWASIKYKDEGELLRGAGDPEQTYIEEILPRKLKFAQRYVERASLRQDIEVIGHTLGAVFGGSPISKKTVSIVNSPTLWNGVARAMTWVHERRRTLVVVADSVLVAACWLAAYLFRLGFERLQPGRPWYDNWVLLGVITLYVAVLKMWGVHRSLWRFFGFEDIKRLMAACFLAGTLAAASVQMLHLSAVSRAVLMLHPIFVLGALSSARMMYRVLFDRARQIVETADGQTKQAIVLGAGETGRLLVAGIHQRDGWNVKCVLDDDAARIGSRISGVPVTGGLHTLLDPETLEGATHVIIALSAEQEGDRLALAHALARETGLPTLAVPSVSGLADAAALRADAARPPSGSPRVRPARTPSPSARWRRRF